MGTIVEKSEYLTETKEKIKDSINNIGGSITNETTFREYAQELDNIYDNLPKTTGESSNLSLTTLKGKMNIIPKGDTKQDSATGSNLMNTEKLVNGTYNGLTITKDSDDFINISGTATANTSIVLSEITYNFPSTLYISYENTFATSTAQLTFFNGSTTLGGLTFSGANRTYNMSTILGDKTCTRIELYVANGNTINGKFRPMLNTQSGQPYSKYAFPNPSYPQNIEVVTGTQEVTISNGDNTETQTQIVSLGDIELCKIGNYQDYFYKSGGKWYKKEYIGKVVGGSINWNYYQITIDGQYANLFRTASSVGSTNTSALSNYYTCTRLEYRSNPCFYINSVLGVIDVVDNRYIDATLFKTYLSNNGVVFYIVLDTPQDIEITNETLIEQLDNLEKMKSYNGVTNINCSGNLSAILSVSALKGE